MLPIVPADSMKNTQPAIEGPVDKGLRKKFTALCRNLNW